MTFDITGQVGLVLGGQKVPFIPWVIRTVTRSEAYHVVIGDSPTTYVGAEPDGVTRRHIDDPAYTHIAWSDFDTLDNAKLPHLRAQLGKPYSYLDDVVIGVDELTPGNLPTSWYDHILNGNSWICSALGDWWLHINGIDLFPGTAVGAIFPGRFEQPWRERGWL